MKIKTTVVFQKTGDIERIARRWAKKTGFRECDQKELRNLADVDNVTCCYYRQSKGTTTFLTLHQLDGKIRIEAWTMQKIAEKKQEKESINQLLVMLGQKPRI